MKAHSPYDCKEKENVEVFRALPAFFQFFIRTVQNRIQEEVEKNNPNRFKPTSGFRAEIINRKYGGARESLHRLGCARDFVPLNGDFSSPPLVDSTRFRVLRSSRCWHIEMRESV